MYALLIASLIFATSYVKDPGFLERQIAHSQIFFSARPIPLGLKTKNERSIYRLEDVEFYSEKKMSEQSGLVICPSSHLDMRYHYIFFVGPASYYIDYDGGKCLSIGIIYDDEPIFKVFRTPKKRYVVINNPEVTYPKCMLPQGTLPAKRDYGFEYSAYLLEKDYFFECIESIRGKGKKK